ncbi:MAG: hypothetical protein LW703_09280 [Rhodobacter sp.]|nr:hypothetical protein [Rhodobacter sp.]
MRVPLFLVLASLAGVGAALSVPGWTDLALLAGLCALAGAILLGAALLRVEVRAAAAPRWVIVDGSNVMYWKGDTPQIEPVRRVLEHLSALGFSPGIVFDANAGYLLAGRYLDHAAFAEALGLAEDRVMVVNKGTPADATILAVARDLGARVVSNDRFRDWLDQHPEAGRPGALIRGGFVDGALWLALDDAALRPVKAQAGSGP